jgi:hypothetical protein
VAVGARNVHRSSFALSLIATAYGARSIGRSGIIDSRILAMGDLAHPVDASVRGTYVTVAARDGIGEVEACAMGDRRSRCTANWRMQR